MDTETGSVESTEPPGSSNEPPNRQFINCTKQEWGNWKWQFKNRLKSIDDLLKVTGKIGNISILASEKFPVAITPYYFSLIREFDNSDPIFRMSMPQSEELEDNGVADPLCEDSMSPTGCLIHRYKDRALLISTTTCAMYCRYCTRKRTVGVKEHVIQSDELNRIVNYLKEHSEVSDVIVSGGDPFTLETNKLEKIISTIREVSSVQTIRIGTKIPVVMPQRVTSELVNMLKNYHPIFINSHFNHPNEITPESEEACRKLADGGFPLGNQSVLLKGVNDNKLIQETLCRRLIRMRVRPYYLFQADLVNGTEHFRTRISRGIEIMDHLRGRLSGIAIPQYVVDSPGGKGKIPILPNYMISQSPEKTILRNYRGELVEYPEPLG